jgi:hypothetical protein
MRRALAEWDQQGTIIATHSNSVLEIMLLTEGKSKPTRDQVEVRDLRLNIQSVAITKGVVDPEHRDTEQK